MKNPQTEKKMRIAFGKTLFFFNAVLLETLMHKWFCKTHIENH